jgi:hypothetical protein
MSSKGIFDIAYQYALDRVIGELEMIYEAENKDLSITIKRRLKQLYNEKSSTGLH